MAEGILLAVAGALLVTPGFITDLVGFTLLFPPSRVAIAKRLLQRVELHSMTDAGHAQPSFQEDASSGPVTLEGDFERKK